MLGFWLGIRLGSRSLSRTRTDFLDLVGQAQQEFDVPPLKKQLTENL
jgi:hypothetical protein